VAWEVDDVLVSSGVVGGGGRGTGVALELEDLETVWQDGSAIRASVMFTADEAERLAVQLLEQAREVRRAGEAPRYAA
jgi:hypothetical protein